MHLVMNHPDLGDVFDYPLPDPVVKNKPPTLAGDVVHMGAPELENVRACARCFVGVTMTNAVSQALAVKNPTNALKKFPAVLLFHSSAAVEQ